MPTAPMDGTRWESDVLGSERPVLVQFWRASCPICAAMEREVQGLADELEGRVPFYRVDCDAEADLVWAYEVLSTPTFIVFCRGEPLSRVAGEVEVAQVRGMALDAEAACASAEKAGRPAPSP